MSRHSGQLLCQALQNSGSSSNSPHNCHACHARVALSCQTTAQAFTRIVAGACRDFMQQPRASLRPGLQGVLTCITYAKGRTSKLIKLPYTHGAPACTGVCLPSLLYLLNRSKEGSACAAVAVAHPLCSIANAHVTAALAAPRLLLQRMATSACAGGKKGVSLKRWAARRRAAPTQFTTATGAHSADAALEMGAEMACS